MNDTTEKQTIRDFWQSLNVSLMPAGVYRFYIGSGGDTYGDVVIWLGRLYISWNWGRPYPREWYQAELNSHGGCDE